MDSTDDLNKYMTQQRVRLGRQVLILRSAAGLTQDDLVDKTGFNRGQIIKVEKGQGNYTLETLLNIVFHLEGYVEILERETLKLTS